MFAVRWLLGSQAQDPDVIFFKELDDFFINVIDTFNTESLYLYQMRIINSYLRYPQYNTLKLSTDTDTLKLSTDTVGIERQLQGRELHEQVTIILTHIFTQKTQEKFTSKSIQLDRRYQLWEVLTSPHITEFPRLLGSLVSAYYSIVDSPPHFTYSYFTPKSYEPQNVRYSKEDERLIPLWMTFLRACINFRRRFGFFPSSQVQTRLDTFIGGYSVECTDDTLESMITHTTRRMQSAGGKRKRSTRNRRSRRYK